jgi:hypothetical protein
MLVAVRPSHLLNDLLNDLDRTAPIAAKLDAYHAIDLEGRACRSCGLAGLAGARHNR